ALRITDEDLRARPRLPGGTRLPGLKGKGKNDTGGPRVDLERYGEGLPASTGDLQRIVYAAESVTFEKRLAEYVMQRPQSVGAVRAAAVLLWHSAENHTPDALDSFGINNPANAGSVGTDVEVLRRVVEEGNIRELVNLLFSAVSY